MNWEHRGGGRAKRSDRLLRWFSPAAHRRGQEALPGFEVEHDGPALSLALYQLGYVLSSP